MLAWVHDVLEDDLCPLPGLSALIRKDDPHFRNNNRKRHCSSQKQRQDVLHDKVTTAQLNAFLAENAYIVSVSMSAYEGKHEDIPRQSNPAKLAGNTNEYAPTLLPTATAKRAPYCTLLLEFVAVNAGS